MRDYHRQVQIGENKVEVLAHMIYDIEKEHNTRLDFETIKKIARKNHFTDDEEAELIVMYF